MPFLLGGAEIPIAGFLLAYLKRLKDDQKKLERLRQMQD
jgi:hypothetical protein